MSEVASSSEQASPRKQNSSPSKHLGGLPAEGFCREHQVLTVFPVSHATLWKMIADGRFPKPTRLGARCSMWPVTVVREFLAKIGGAA